MNRHHILILAGLVFALVCVVGGRDARAQQKPLNPQKALTQYVHQNWQADEGLPQNTVGAVVQTRDGYLWLGTEEGLVRFDGVRFTIFDKSNTAVFEKSQVIHALAEDNEGALWIGVMGGGLIRYAGGEFTRYNADQGFEGETVSTLYIDRAGRLWVGTRDAGLYVRDQDRFARFTAESRFNSTHIYAFYQDRAGAQWIATEDGLHRLKDGVITVYRYTAAQSDDLVLAIHEDQTGTMWLGTRSGLSTLRDGVLQAFVPEDDTETVGSVWAFWEDSQGSLWFGMDNGLARLNNDRFETFSEEDGLSHDRILALYQDREGSLWIGTQGGGLNRLWDGKFTTYTTQEGLSHNGTLTVYEDNEGVVWIGTESGGVNRLHNGEIAAFTTEDGLSSDFVTSVYQDRSGALWIATLGGGLNRLKDGVFTHYTHNDGLPSDDVFVVYGDDEGNLWMGTDAGVARLRDGRFTTYTTDDGLGSNFVTALLQDRHGALWIGTYDAGLNRLHNGEITAFTTDDGLASNLVLALHEDTDGAFWIGTYEGGLTRLVLNNAEGPDGSLTTFSSREGLFSDNVYQILEDDQGVLWMSCNKGLFSVSKDTLNAFAKGRIDHFSSTVYDKADGLKSHEFNGGTQPAGWKGRDGTLWFPSVQGVSMVNPANIRHNPLPPPVVIEEMIVNNKAVAQRGRIELAPGMKKFEFTYTAPSFIAPEAIEFRVFLKGYDEEWQDAGTNRTATYTNLSPGSYTFLVKARNSDGVWNDTGASVSLTLRPHFYQATWFLLLCVLALLAIGYAGYRLRIRHLKARKRELERVVDERTHQLRLEKEKTEQAKEVIEAQAEKLKELDRFKTRFFANVSHEFRTPLTMIIGPLESALHGSYGVVEGTLHRQLEIMLRNALRLMRLINQLLDLSKLEAGKMVLRARPRNVVPFVEGIVQSCMPLAEQKKIDLIFRADSKKLELYYEPDKLEKVIFNLLSNALKYTPAKGSIITSLCKRPATTAMPEGAVELRVHDTGQGIPAADLPYIFDRFRQVDGSNTREHEGTGIGLALVKELVLLHHGAIDVESEPGVGTTFTVLLPHGTAHLQTNEILQDTTEDDQLSEAGVLMELSTDLAIARDETHAFSVNGHAPEAPGKPPLVLIIDDNADVREYVGSILSDTYQIATAHDGWDGLEKARSLKPDLILSDVMMPKMDGHELCRRLKADADLQFTPLILLTARATNEMKLEGLEKGADDYMTKPFNARELKARVGNLIRLYEQENALKSLNESLEDKVQEQFEVMLRDRREYETRLLDAKEKAEASERLKSAILDNVSHEFRTPVSVILGCADIIAQDAPHAFKDFASDIKQNSQRLMRTLDSLLTLSQLEARTRAVNLQPLNLSDLVQAALMPYQEVAQERGLTLRFEASTDDNLVVNLDAEAVRYIVENLINNALKFTDEGGVRVDVQRDGETVHLRVEDTGIGIDTDFLPHLFEAFTQESSGWTRTYEGTGLGLTITKRLTELMGGTISVETEKGRGCVFTASFKRASHTDREPKGPSRQPRGRQEIKKGSSA